ncbi:SET domain-containing protein [Compostibacter hankyongensis]|uniref:SET domain-containing protein-lysine N-methyltransferase n=1 Tax=Compostibacter hankyongensis TaxID=1007089 RepID=A0ABP8G940_9BACT
MKIKPYLYVRESKGKGRGVFTKEAINKGILIEEAPVLVLSDKDTVKALKTHLYNYLFDWSGKHRSCVALGWASLYNHSYTPNCAGEFDFKKKVMKIKTIRKIEKGEELFINYNGAAEDESPLWFKVKKQR